MTAADDPTRDGQPAWRARVITRSLGVAHARAEERVQEFIDASYALIDERGTADFTVQEIAERCNQSIRSFYKCFASKDELLLALFEDSVLEQTVDLRSVVEHEADPLARLRAFTIRLYEWCQPEDAVDKPGRHKHGPITDFAVQLSSVQPRRVETAMEPVSHLLLELMDDAVAAGVIRSSDTQRTAGLMKQMVMYSWFRNRGITDPAQRLTAEEIWDFCLHGIGA